MLVMLLLVDCELISTKVRISLERKGRQRLQVDVEGREQVLQLAKTDSTDYTSADAEWSPIPELDRSLPVGIYLLLFFKGSGGSGSEEGWNPQLTLMSLT